MGSSNFTGPYCVRCICCSCCCGFPCFKCCDYCHCCTVPMCFSYNFFLPSTETFVCFGPCLPFPVPCCTCSRSGNRLIHCSCSGSGQHGDRPEKEFKGAQLMVIDEERGTLAYYCIEAGCGDDKLNAKPCCMFRRIF